MKFLKNSAYYLDFIDSVYRTNEGMNQWTYDKQMAKLFSYRFALSDFWKTILENTGTFEVSEVIFNAENAQKRWAQENGVAYSEMNWKHEILEAQIEHFKPEVIFFQDYGKTPSYYKAKYPFVKYIISWDGLANQNLQMFNGTDLIASSHLDTVEFYQKHKIPTYHFRFGFEPRILAEISQNDPKYDISFVGSVNLSARAHNTRISALAKLNKELDTAYWLSGSQKSKFFSGSNVKNLLYGNLMQRRDLNEIMKKNRGTVFGLEMLQVLADSKITFNSHIDAAGRIAGNLRLYEATGVGTCLLTDWKKNLHEFFEIDKEIVAYRSIGECIEKAKWLLENDTKRREIAAAGQRRTLTEYSMDKMVLDLMRYAKLI